MNRILLCILLLAGLSVKIQAQQVRFTRKFAPSELFTKPMESPYRDDICLNGSWKFCPVTLCDEAVEQQVLHPEAPAVFAWEKVPVKVPSPWNVNSFATEQGGGDFVTFPSYPSSWNQVKAGWLMRKFLCKQEWKGKRLILHFEAVAGYAQVFINKKKVAENFDVFLPFEVDITDKINRSGDNELLLWIADANLLNQPGKYGRRLHVGGSFWGQHIIGIWQDVHLQAKPVIYEKNTFIKSWVSKDELEVTSTVVNTSGIKAEVTVNGNVAPWINLAGQSIPEAPEISWKLGAEIIGIPGKKLILAPGEERTVTLTINNKGRLKLWSSKSPNLYGLVISLNDRKGIIDKQYSRFGWREFNITGNQFNLNGERVVLKGDSWHFMGIPQMTRRYAWAWFTMLKDAHANAVRLHAQPYPAFYLDMADEMGIYILDETGMWASDGGPKEDGEAYWANAASHLRRFIIRDRNHPSVFGWSVCNENIPVAVYVHHSPDSLVQKQLKEINRWVAITREEDPTRNWISGDGETGLPTNLPTIIGHYGDENAYRDWSSTGKLWGIGEAGMAYYGTPRQTSVYNGNRSYESQQGRMEGVAAEAIHLSNIQKKYDASYRSVFNIVWYGLQPLELGMKNISKAPEPGDGIFFNPFLEGQPGVQPERLGPYTSTLNPGYDPALPLYRSWPLFDAIQASFADSTELKEKSLPTVLHDDSLAVLRSTVSDVLLLSADTNGKLAGLLQDLGVKISGHYQPDSSSLIIIDGMYPPSGDTAVVRSVLKKSGNVLIWGVRPEVSELINHYLPTPVKVIPRNATSFLTGSRDPAIEGLDNTALYFSETSDQPVANYGLSGDFVKNGKILLTACNTDWKAWNSKPEYAKTISVLRSERESKPEGNVMVTYPYEKGNVCFLTLDPFVLYKTSEKVFSRLLRNQGIVMNDKSLLNSFALNTNGILEKAVLQDSAIEGPSDKRINAVGGIFDLTKGGVKALPAYISFWLYSPRSLVNLLAEPDMPVLNIHVNSKGTFNLFLNEKPVEQVSNGKQIKALPLDKGWNHIVIKKDNRNDRSFGVKFDCSNENFLSLLRLSLSSQRRQ